MTRLLALLLLLLPVFADAGDCGWPAWQQFKQDLVSEDGRVIDYATDSQITTSEGQSYAMFFALVADDRQAFARLLRWTQDNLTDGGLQQGLPAWSWGRNGQGSWEILDRNNASDADLWMAYSLLEAGRLWNRPDYLQLGSELLWRSTAETVSLIPGLGLQLLPARYGFAQDGLWRLNPSYLPPQLARRFAALTRVWQEIGENNLVLLEKSAPLGFAADWMDWDGQQAGFTSASGLGSYDAIRVYLWLGLLAEDDPQRQRLLVHFQPMADYFMQHGQVPERINVGTGQAEGLGPAGFQAALVPFLSAYPQMPASLLQEAGNSIQSGTQADAYYDRVLSLFAAGREQDRYRFDKNGLLHRGQGTDKCR